MKNHLLFLLLTKSATPLKSAAPGHYSPVLPLVGSLVTTGLKRVFYHLKSVNCERADMWKSFGLVVNEKEWVAWFCCLLDLSSGVMSRASFQLFLQLQTASEILRIYVKRWAGCRNFILQLFPFLHAPSIILSSRPIAQNVKVSFKKHAWEHFQHSSVLFDNRFELNNDLKAIVAMTRPNRHQSKTAGRHFSPDNVFESI